MNSPPIRIEEFSGYYQEQALALINENMRERFGYVDASKNPDLHDIEKSFQHGVFLVAIDGNEGIVGTGSLMPAAPETGRIARIHTSAKYRRRGIASLVLNRLEAQAKARRFGSLVLETNIDWYDAISFYLSHGFKEVTKDEVEIHFHKSLSNG